MVWSIQSCNEEVWVQSKGIRPHTVFFRKRNEKLTVLITYIYDMIITGNNTEEIQILEEKLSREFEIKNLDGLKYFLGIEVAHSNQENIMSQRKYILDLLTKVEMLDCRPIDTPIVLNLKLGEFLDQVPTNKGKYQRLVGKLIYLSHSRLDIAYAVSLLSQFMHNLSENHMEAVMTIITYLKGAPGRGIHFRGDGHLEVMGSDAD